MEELQLPKTSQKAPLEIITLGHPTLRKKARALSSEEIKSREVQDFINKMTKTLVINGNGVALAANQVDTLWQIIVFEIKNMSTKVVINPKIIKASGEEEVSYEGCLSIPGYWGMVGRMQKVVVEGLNQNAEKVKVKASGFNARVLFHEIDHLQGVLFIDRMKDLSTLITTKELERQVNERKKKIAEKLHAAKEGQS